LAIGALVLAVAAGCGPADRDQNAPEERAGTIVTDDTGHQIEFQAVPTRIISIAPNITETLFALEADDRLVAVTDICDFPPEAKEKLNIGSFVSPSSEKIMAFEPDLVIGCGTLHPVLGRLRELSVPVLSFNPKTIDELLVMIEKVGSAVGKEDAARGLTAPLRDEIGTVRSQAATLDATDTVKVFIEIWHDPLTTAGAGSFVNDLVESAGAVNIATSVGRHYFQLSQEHVLDADPEVILTAYMERGVSARDMILKRDAWQTVSAVSSGRIVDDIDPDLLLRPSMRAVRTVKKLAERFYPELFRAQTQ
jgi:iron complex transport system substrate-binding protein